MASCRSVRLEHSPPVSSADPTEPLKGHVCKKKKKRNEVSGLQKREVICCTWEGFRYAGESIHCARCLFADLWDLFTFLNRSLCPAVLLSETYFSIFMAVRILSDTFSCTPDTFFLSVFSTHVPFGAPCDPAPFPHPSPEPVSVFRVSTHSLAL